MGCANAKELEFLLTEQDEKIKMLTRQQTLIEKRYLDYFTHLQQYEPPTKVVYYIGENQLAHTADFKDFAHVKLKNLQERVRKAFEMMKQKIPRDIQENPDYSQLNKAFMADYFESADMLPSQVRLPRDLTRKDEGQSRYKKRDTMNPMSIRTPTGRTPTGRTDMTPKSSGRSQQNTSRTKF